MKQSIFKTPKGRSIEFSELGFGCAPLGNLYRALSETQARQTLEAAWSSGIRYFDTAPQYGHGLSEMRMADFLANLPRDSYKISSKVGRLLEPCAPNEVNSGAFINTPNNKIVYDYSYEGVMRSFEASLARLKIDRLDIVYIHDVDVFTHGSQQESDRRVDEVMEGGYRALCELRDNGNIAAIGVGVNEWQVCEKMAQLGDFDLFLLAGRYTLLEQEALDSFLPLCEKQGIGIVLGGPFNSGILATGAIEGAMYNYEPAAESTKDRVRAIEQVCHNHQVTLAQAAIAFPMLHPSVVSVIPGGQSSVEVIRNCATLNHQIDVSLWQELKAQGLLHPKAPVSS
ncbi:MAG: aldo/keto reductase [Oceanospirillaceae bacterium]|nr:aldo/keto reductase [Oceanospirillaceae bacterium]